MEMANEYIPRLFWFNFGGSIYKHRGGGNAKHLQVHSWQIYSIGAMGFLKCIFPYLKLKRNEAELAINFQEGKLGRKHNDKSKFILEEAQQILISEMKNKTEVVPNG